MIKAETFRCERYILRELGFMVSQTLVHPHRYILQYIHALCKGDYIPTNRLSQIAWGYLNDRLVAAAAAAGTSAAAAGGGIPAAAAVAGIRAAAAVGSPAAATAAFGIPAAAVIQRLEEVWIEDFVLIFCCIIVVIRWLLCLFFVFSMRTTLCCEVQPAVVAVGSIFLAACDLNIHLAKETGWYELFDVTWEDVLKVCTRILSLYKRGPPKYTKLAETPRTLPPPKQEASTNTKIEKSEDNSLAATAPPTAASGADNASAGEEALAAAAATTAAATTAAAAAGVPAGAAAAGGSASGAAQVAPDPAEEEEMQLDETLDKDKDKKEETKERNAAARETTDSRGGDDFSQQRQTEGACIDQLQAAIRAVYVHLGSPLVCTASNLECICSAAGRVCVCCALCLVAVAPQPQRRLLLLQEEVGMNSTATDGSCERLLRVIGDLGKRREAPGTCSRNLAIEHDPPIATEARSKVMMLLLTHR